MSLANNEPTKLMLRSKKIQKKKKKEQSENSQSSQKKPYENFESSDKKLILQAILKKVLKLKAVLESFELADLSSLIDKTTLDVSDFNSIILNIIPDYDKSFSPTTEQYRKWRKRIRYWALALDRPDNRGDPNVPKDRLEEFNSGVIKILGDIKTRNFDVLHKKLLSLLEEMGLKKNNNVCGKHWWWTYLQQNEEVQRCWSKKKIIRGGNKDREPDEIDDENSFYQQMLIQNSDVQSTGNWDSDPEEERETDEIAFWENLEIVREEDDQSDAEENPEDEPQSRDFNNYRQPSPSDFVSYKNSLPVYGSYG